MEATLSGCKRHLKTRQYQLAGVVSGRLQPTGIKKMDNFKIDIAWHGSHVCQAAALLEGWHWHGILVTKICAPFWLQWELRSWTASGFPSSAFPRLPWCACSRHPWDQLVLELPFSPERNEFIDGFYRLSLCQISDMGRIAKQGKQQPVIVKHDSLKGQLRPCQSLKH